jgi:hypothetical protein
MQRDEIVILLVVLAGLVVIGISAWVLWRDWRAHL